MIKQEDLPKVIVGSTVAGHYERGSVGQEYTFMNPYIAKVAAVLGNQGFRLEGTPGWIWYPDELEIINEFDEVL